MTGHEPGLAHGGWVARRRARIRRAGPTRLARLEVGPSRRLRASADRARPSRRGASQLERELGYARVHTARERLRVASALEELPAVETALARGELCFSAVRESVGWRPPKTEQDWLDAVRGKSLRMVEELVSGKAPGDRPGDPDRPDVRMHRLTLELSPDVYARLREARTRLADEDGIVPTTTGW